MWADLPEADCAALAGLLRETIERDRFSLPPVRRLGMSDEAA